ncbi:glutathione S-transferase [Shewanella sp. WXL01]|uniref:glutathione S-transferase n=1 Tax=Shewanella sp. WXL01 TaxID=2709721 RepID=UPI0014385849|nr:glutathione S-transferase [Shewanella sp. WXL01]NKF50477.1 glutathione S-transferase [Shewanella sp. WXL01]
MSPHTSQAVLYTFRRCPYAMRGRIGLHLSSLNPQIREIILKHKPQEMLAISPKGTVPVLCLDEAQAKAALSERGESALIIDESLDIFTFALTKHPSTVQSYLDKDDYQLLLQSLNWDEAKALISQNDGEFKQNLDRYKYADRYPEFTEQDYRDRGCEFIAKLEQRLEVNTHLFANSPTFADFAIFPFVRQFAHVDKKWFESAPYPKVRNWLTTHLESKLFADVMRKYPLWLDDKDHFIALQSS